jgi:hypothetical protein
MENFNVTSDDLDKTLWRHMDLPRFLFLLEYSTLFFAKAGLFNDQWEGLHNAIGDNDYYDITNEGKIIRIPAIKDKREQDNTDSLKIYFRNYVESIRRSVGISCWSMSENESMAMWERLPNESVAIKSTFSDILDSISLSDNDVLHIGKINYINYNSQKIPIDNLFNATFYKNIHYDHEKEARLLCYQVNDPTINVFDPGNLKPISENNGLYVSVNVKQLLKEIVISPKATKWFHELIERVIGKYGVGVAVKNSVIKWNA